MRTYSKSEAKANGAMRRGLKSGAMHRAKILRHAATAMLATAAFSCMDSYGPQPEENITATGDRGIFITNEGNFMYGNGSLSYYDIGGMKIENNVFQRRNGIPPGDVVQSMAVYGDKGYIVVNNSGAIHVINTKTFERTGIITGLVSPRYIHILNERKAYVSDMYAKKIWIADLSTERITGSIDIEGEPGTREHSSEQMVQIGDKVFTNSYLNDNKILAIDTENDKLCGMVETGLEPGSICTDKYGRLWAISTGGYPGSPYGHENPRIFMINTETLEIEYEQDLSYAISSGSRASGTAYGKKENLYQRQPHGTAAPEGEIPDTRFRSVGRLCTNGAKDTIYYLNGGVWRFSADDYENHEEIIKTENGIFYGLGVDPETSEIYVSDAIDYVQNAVVVRYRPDSSPVDTFKVGISPGSFTFVSYLEKIF